MKFKRLTESSLESEVSNILSKVARQYRVNLKKTFVNFGDISEVSFVIGGSRTLMSFCARGSGSVLNAIEDETYIKMPDQNDISEVSEMMNAYKEMVDAVSNVISKFGYEIPWYTVGLR